MQPGKWMLSFYRITAFASVVTMLMLIYQTINVNRMPQHFPAVEKMVGNVDNIVKEDAKHREVVDNYYAKRKDMSLTPLGKILFLNAPRPKPKDKNFKIMVYEVGKKLELRLLYFFQVTKHDPFELCSVKNCELTYDNADFSTADAVLFHLHIFNKEYHIPENLTRSPHQRWIFYSDESPNNTFLFQANDWYNYSGIFNWSMVARYEADVPVAFGRVLPLEKPVILPKYLTFEDKVEALVPYGKQKRRDILVCVLTSNCYTNNRIQYIQKLQKHIKVDVYGRCGAEELKDVCLWGGYGRSCEVMQKYVFYLSFLNSNCDGYISEKVYTHALKVGAIPIFMGMHTNQSDIYIPPGAYIHIDDFKTPEDLAKYLLHINETFEESYLKFHEWRKHFRTVEEDGYMGSPSLHYCRICEALNYNDESPKVYQRNDLAFFLDPELNCFGPNW